MLLNLLVIRDLLPGDTEVADLLDAASTPEVTEPEDSAVTAESLAAFLVHEGLAEAKPGR